MRNDRHSLNPSVLLAIFSIWTGAAIWFGYSGGLLPGGRAGLALGITAALAAAYCFRRIQAVAERHRQEARTDLLTGIGNRRAFEERAAEAVRNHPGKPPLTVILIDLDDFKSVNDRLGHAAGDETLQLVARTLKAHVRAGDLVSRIGGDEFAVVLGEPPKAPAESIVERLHGELTRALSGTALPITCSMGVTQIAPGAPDAREAIGRADRLMYQAKRGGKNSVKAQLASR